MFLEGMQTALGCHWDLIIRPLAFKSKNSMSTYVVNYTEPIIARIVLVF